MVNPLMIGLECHASGLRAALVDLTPDDACGHTSPLIASAQLPASADAPDRIAGVLRALVAAEPKAAQAASVAVVTTEFEDAIGHGHDLARTGCVRLEVEPNSKAGAPEVAALTDWPDSLRTRVGGLQRTAPGGCQFDGRRSDLPGQDELAQLADELRADDVEAVAVTGTFASVDPRAELEVALALRRLLPGIPVSISQPLGSIGLLARENAAVLNAALLPMAARVTEDLRRQINEVLPQAGAYLTRVDGTLMEVQYAAGLPALTLGAVRAARVRGAARLAGHDECLVVVPDGGSAQAHLVREGEPLHASRGLRIHGVQTSLTTIDADTFERPSHRFMVGRGSGRRELALVVLGSPVADLEVAPLASSADAGAVGAVASTIAGVVDRIVAAGRSGDAQLVAVAEQDARTHAVLAGATEASVRVIQVTETPLAYMPGDLVRLRVVASGQVPNRQDGLPEAMCSLHTLRSDHE